MKSFWMGLAVAAVVTLNPLGLALMKAELGNLPDFAWAEISVSYFTPVMAGFSLYLATFALWVALIGLNPLTIIQPIGLGLMIIMTSAISYWRLGEHLGPAQLLGTALIIAGVAFLAGEGRRRGAGRVDGPQDDGAQGAGVR